MASAPKAEALAFSYSSPVVAPTAQCLPIASDEGSRLALPAELGRTQSTGSPTRATFFGQAAPGSPLQRPSYRSDFGKSFLREQTLAAGKTTRPVSVSRSPYYPNVRTGKFNSAHYPQSSSAIDSDSSVSDSDSPISLRLKAGRNSSAYSSVASRDRPVNKRPSAVPPDHAAECEISRRGRLLSSAAVALHLCAALLMIVASKWVLTRTNVPFTFLFGQLLIPAMLMKGLALTGRIKLPAITKSAFETMTPSVICSLLTLLANTFCLQAVDLGYFQIARGLTLPLTLTLAVFGSDVSSVSAQTMTGARRLPVRYSTLAVLGASIVSAGYISGTYARPVNVQSFAIGLGLASSTLTAYQTVNLKRKLRHAGLTGLETVYFGNLFCAAAMAPLLLVNMEYAVAREMYLEGGHQLNVFLLGTMTCGLCAFVTAMISAFSSKINVSTYQLTATIIRTILQTLIGIKAFDEQLTDDRAISLATIVTGVALYSVAANRNNPQAQEQGDRQRLINRDSLSRRSIARLRTFIAPMSPTLFNASIMFTPIDEKSGFYADKSCTFYDDAQEKLIYNIV
ncbi:uncharacterized protein L969DRAFT_93340 [Mixia osmundae IAM 14324]|uniref:Sugar phosphate transporter domain-containing protein n=1 Tax=Mixia osmundae (strain CBS 9802 / IAM 14324 / JCM 22182 / KY 12970) TaxID=764103 RepID=G7E5C9_MIXOS|nr:uncharacterized protein L969DRAFT_93340 [Mixia osmundae IAM 14324]KEI40808.1 hypothetical protein L969DRAFT_93340 [Mixia osmundae IAM 14324]GAA98039.1 hypothetical protein E5Q_04720 [Mixia osmundae IAM 14324]